MAVVAARHPSANADLLASAQQYSARVRMMPRASLTQMYRTSATTKPRGAYVGVGRYVVHHCAAASDAMAEQKRYGGKTLCDRLAPSGPRGRVLLEAIYQQLVQPSGTRNAALPMMRPGCVTTASMAVVSAAVVSAKRLTSSDPRPATLRPGPCGHAAPSGGSFRARARDHLSGSRPKINRVTFAKYRSRASLARQGVQGVARRSESLLGECKA
jgi:hypothetical protein